jgi:hypothetical protein
MDNLLNHTDMTYVHGGSDKRSVEKKGWKNVQAVSKKQRQQIYEAVASNTVKRVVATGIYRVGVNFPELQLLINAEGMGSEIIAGQLPGRASRNVDGKDVAFMIDFYAPWDEITSGTSMNPKPGYIARDAAKRSEVYAGPSLGFEQIWLQDINGIRDVIGLK